MTTRALLLENIHPDGSARLAKEGYQVDTMPRALDEDELIEAIDDVNLLGIRSKTQITERVLEAAPSLVAVGAFCIGTNQIDLAAASRRGVAVFNAPFSNTRTVVELALAEIIALTRRLPEKTTQMHAGVWDKSAAGATRCAAARSASSATATSAPSCRCSPRTSACPSSSTTSPISSRSATRAAARPWTSCWSRWTSSPCTWTAGMATTASSARPSSP